MTDIHTQRAFTGYIATLLFLFASSAIAGLNIGGNVIWHDAANGARIEILGPHPDLDIPAIIYNITDASETKPYLIKLGAGIYDLESDMLRMKEWVSIQGSGQEATKLTRTGRYAVIGADNVALTDLTVEITGNADVTGISNNNVSPRIERVHVIASGNGGSRGVYIFSSHTIMNNVTASASGVGTENIGVNIQDSSPILTNVTASASGGTYNLGVEIVGSSSPFIKDSILEGDTVGLYIGPFSSSDVRVVNSKIIGV